MLDNPKKPQLSTDFVENLCVKDKELLEENDLILVESYFAGFRVQISSQNREASLIHPMGETRKLLLYISFNILFCKVAVN